MTARHAGGAIDSDRAHVEALALRYLGGQLRNLLLIDLLLRLLDQAEDIAHAEDSRCHAVRVKGLERVGLFAHTHEADRLAGDALDAERATATTRADTDCGPARAEGVYGAAARAEVEQRPWPVIMDELIRHYRAVIEAPALEVAA